MAPSTLRQLLGIISAAVENIEGIYGAAGVDLPSLDDPFNAEAPSESMRSDPQVAAATMNIIAAAAQMTASVRHPVQAAITNAYGFHISACLRTASELNVVEILREAGPEGLHATTIAARSGVNPDIVARILRLLATNHIFREISPGVFANNKISSTLDKGKPSAVLFDKPEDRFSGSSGPAALVEFAGDECLKAASYLCDTVLDPASEQSPVTRAFNSNEPMFQWFMRPENKYRNDRFAIAMHGTTTSDPAGLIFTGFDWSRLSDGGKLVDVGCGLGTISLEIAKRYPTLRVVNQDLGQTVERSKLHWLENFPGHINNKMVEFQAHDFFHPQPVHDADVFMLRHIIHDWPDSKCRTILRHLRDAAKPTTQLVVIESILPVAASGEADDPRINSIHGAMRSTAPPPLLPNRGVAAAGLYSMDMTVHNMVGGAERTVGGFVDVFERAGWKVVRIHRLTATEKCHIVGVPI